MEIKFNSMCVEDLDKLKDSLENDYDDFWNYNVFKKELENDNSYYIVAKADDEILGFAGFMIIIDQADITNIVVKKSLRNNKIGTQLLKNTLDYISTFPKIESVTLEVKNSNVNAIKLYEKFDFHSIGFRKKYYKDGSDAIIMKKDII